MITEVKKPVTNFLTHYKKSTISHETYTSEISNLFNSIDKRRCYAYVYLQAVTSRLLDLSRITPSDQLYSGLKHWYDKLYPAVKIIINLNNLNDALFRLEKRYLQLAHRRDKRPHWKGLVVLTSQYELKAIFDIKNQINSLINKRIDPEIAAQLMSNVEKLRHLGKNVDKYVPILANITNDPILDEKAIINQMTTIINKFVLDEPVVLRNNIQYMKSLHIKDDRSN
jgi:hypothetical protein